MKNRKKIFIYGKNFHARSAFRKLKKQTQFWDIIAFITNDKEEVKNKFFNLPVFHIDKLKTLDFDLIVVAGRYVKEMTNTLHRAGVLFDKIWIMKRSEFQLEGQDLQLRSKKIDSILKILLPLLHENNIDHWFIASSLLALKREQDLAWFNDVDIAIPENSIEFLNTILQNHSKFHSVETFRRNGGTVKSNTNTIYKIVIKSKSNIILNEPAIIDMHPISTSGNKALYSFGADEFLSTEKCCFLSFDTIQYKNFVLKIPVFSEIYLNSTYGEEWKKPSDFFDHDSHLGRIKA